MISSFYYLAAYTAAVAAGFSIPDSAAIARAARYTQDCAGITAPQTAPSPPEDPTGQLLARVLFHYLPGDAHQILQEVDPTFLTGPNKASAPVLTLICQPGGDLCQQAVHHVLSGMLSGKVPSEQVLQSIGILCHILIDTYVHQGFAGVDCAPVNGVTGIMSAEAPLPYENRRQLLKLAQTQPLDTLFNMTPVTPDPAAGTTGCGQVENLVDCPAGVFTYQSPWAKIPLVSCVNPSRYADAYFSLKNVLLYLRNRAAGLERSPSDTDENHRLDAAAFFGGICSERQLSQEWLSFFGWLRRLPVYIAPNSTDDASYLWGFEIQALQLREALWKASPLLRAYVSTLPEPPAPEAAPIPGDPEKPAGAAWPSAADQGLVKL